MAAIFNIVLTTLAVTVNAAPPAQQSIYSEHAPAQLKQANPLDYYQGYPGEDNYYRSAEQKQENSPNAESDRLETLDPDSEVELVPGVQPPQQPPQQNPIAPHIPGLLPGHRVFIVQMPVPGYRPGTIGSYQPVYILAAGAQGNPGFPTNGFQNAVFLDSTGQTVVSPLLGYGPRGIVAPQLLGTPLQLQRPYDLVYQDPGLANAGGPVFQNEAGREAIRFTNGIGLQRPVNPTAYQGPAVAIQSQAHNTKEVNAAQLQQKQPIEETKESIEQKSSHRSSPALLRNKA